MLSAICIGGSSLGAYAQQVTIEFSKTKLPINEYFTISIKLRNQPLQGYGDFPEIEGFKKSSRTNTTTRIDLDNKTIIEQIITQNYAALQEGKFTLKPFSIVVNGKNIASRGTIITIEPMAEEPDEAVSNPEKELPVVKPREIKPFKSQSFLSVEADKSEVYVGEGVFVRLAFYLAEAEQGQLAFHNFNQQYPELIKQLRQKDAWEEAFDEEAEIKPDTIAIRGNKYLKFNLYKRLLYPINAKPLVFKEISLIMSHRPGSEGFAATGGPINLVPFTSRAKTVAVKALPPHPLRDKVPVGQYRLREGISRTVFRPGQSFTYRFEVIGEGNLKALVPPPTPLVTGLDIYPPEIQFTVGKISGQMQGTKRFRYSLLAKAPGQFDLKRLFSLVYFNPATHVYDTLQSGLVINVRGEESNVAGINPEVSDPFYKLISNEENELADLNEFNEIKLYTNVVILFLICVSVYLFLKSYK